MKDQLKRKAELEQWLIELEEDICSLREAEMKGAGLHLQEPYEVTPINEYFENEKLLEGP